MSRFTESPDGRWPLAAAIDDLVDAVRRAARPGWIWIAGLLYPSVTMTYGTGGWSDDWESLTTWSAFATSPDGLTDVAGAVVLQGLLLLPLVFLWARLNAGLARLAPPEMWRRHGDAGGPPGLGDAWVAGRGMTKSVFWMRVSLGALRLGLIVLMSMPTIFAWGVIAELGSADVADVALAVLALPLLALLLVYNLLLSMLLQLGLHSLAHNRRGVASALQHAWSLVRHDPWAASRALVGELVIWSTVSILSLAVVLALGLAAALIGPLVIPAGIVAGLGLVAVAGLVGVARALFWSRAYRALGGLSPDDGVPGLEDESVAGAPAR